MFINVMDNLTDSSAVDILLVRSDTMLYYQIIVFNAGPPKTCKWYVNCIQCLVLPIYGMYRGFFLSVEMCNTDIYYVCHMI